MKHYIAYGSNLNIQQMGYRCPSASPIGSAVIKGYDLVYKGSKTGAYLTIEEGDGEVPVGVWEVSPSDEKALDFYEGYPRFYYKKEIKVEVDGKEIDAFVYIMRENRPYGIPSEWYIEDCRKGYEDFGLDVRYLDKAYKRTVEECYGMSKVRKAI